MNADTKVTLQGVIMVSFVVNATALQEKLLFTDKTLKDTVNSNQIKIHLKWTMLFCEG